MKTIKLLLLGGIIMATIGLSPAAQPFENSPTLLADGQEAQKPAVKNVSVSDFEKLRAKKENVVLDVRTEKEFNAGHMPGAVNIDFNGPDFEQKVKKLDPSKTYLVHCAGGRRSANACKAMEKMNFEKLYNLEGGYKAWEKAGNTGVK